MDALLTSCALVALAEMGDKTQLLAMLLATRFREPVPIILTAWIGGLYLLGVRALRARGDSWPVARTISPIASTLPRPTYVAGSGLCRRW